LQVFYFLYSIKLKKNAWRWFIDAGWWSLELLVQTPRVATGPNAVADHGFVFLTKAIYFYLELII
jgi:hypothetical protein